MISGWRQESESYTVYTLEQLHQDYPDDTLHLLMGEDMFLTLKSWHKAERICQLAVLCVVPRSEDGIPGLKRYAEELHAMGGRTKIVPMAYLPVSSTEIRHRVRCGVSFDELVPQAVEEYIKSRHLYQEGSDMTREDYKEIVRPFLSDRRFYHSECVAAEAEKLAKVYGSDPEKAWIAGILHDIMKELPPEEQLKKIKSFGIILTDLERNAQKLWHSILGAAYIKNELHITDPEIVDPVLYHTTARADMTLPEKILFIADYISADRRYDGVEEMRRVAYEDLDRAVLLGSRETIRDLAERYMAIHPDTMGAFNWCVMNQRISK